MSFPFASCLGHRFGLWDIRREAKQTPDGTLAAKRSPGAPNGPGATGRASVDRKDADCYRMVIRATCLPGHETGRRAGRLSTYRLVGFACLTATKSPVDSSKSAKRSPSSYLRTSEFDRHPPVEGWTIARCQTDIDASQQRLLNARNLRRVEIALRDSCIFRRRLTCG